VTPELIMLPVKLRNLKMWPSLEICLTRAAQPIMVFITLGCAWMVLCTAALRAAVEEKLDVERLIQQLTDKDLNIGFAAEHQLVAIGPDAVPALWAARKGLKECDLRDTIDRCIKAIQRRTVKIIRNAVGGIVDSPGLAKENGRIVVPKPDGRVRIVALNSIEKAGVGLPLLKVFPEVEILKQYY